MSSSLLLILIVVVWLFVLMPLVVNTRKPIRRTSDALGKTRVLHRGGEKLSATRRRPAFKESDIRVSEDVDDSLETVDAQVDDEVDGNDVLIDDVTQAPEEPEVAEVVEGDVVYELAAAEAPEEPGDDEAAQVEDGPEESRAESEPDAVLEAITDDEIERDDEQTRADSSDASSSAFATVRGEFVDTDDLMYEEAESDDAESPSEQAEAAESDEAESEAEESDAEEGVLVDDTLTDDDYAFAEKRRGRGGFDPVSDAHYAQTRFARRRRSVAGLAAFIVAGIILGVIVGSWAWWIPLLGVGLMAVYLVNLRRTVRAEQELRARRIRRMKMARLGVRHRDDDELGIPQRLRRPGMVVVELDDEDPDFADLPYAEYEFDEDDFQPEHRARVS